MKSNIETINLQSKIVNQYSLIRFCNQKSLIIIR
jgi:hypothetical protein